MERLYATYNSEIEFIIVYIREAHPEMLRDGNKTGIVGRPKDLDQRTILATECVSKFKFTIPMVIDRMEGTVNSDYQAAPVRVTVTDVDGKVAYYAGRGPFDFRLNKVEKVLKKLVANEGRLPPPPPPVWGAPANGLRLGVSMEPQTLRLGEEVTVWLTFENIGKEPVNLYFDADRAEENLVFKNSKGVTLSVMPSDQAGMMGRFRKRMRRMEAKRPRVIEPGKSFVTEMEGTIESNEAAAGVFEASLRYAVDGDAVADAEPPASGSPWTGEVASGACAMKLGAALVLGCADCHGDKDYHHEVEQDCSICHTGSEETKDFDTNFEACGNCHAREDETGRRQILGPAGEFDRTSVHHSDELVDGVCLTCHDHGQHRKGVVQLKDLIMGETVEWTGSDVVFCLSCHSANPPAGVSFPKPKGSGYDKSAFLGSDLHQGGMSCADCHEVHGSEHKSLLKEATLKSPH